ncbi:shikimate dehydrogenase [Marinospirillum alkaliphilum]|uniref:Shikimate dehydrogenase (NADP(+)) n=1 Tax=Marinospirillum alkaliphilum DSM 21637 TaxID=1122209 RepID=A0A1K1ZWR6_9GAMM|nr:shikimate dehydrogenase [Marinospirillum alkaliphilum]SFX78630.1 shikimate dehydrogenase [Marinospirillum alkaliphilum DSM 21637]
MDHYAVFGNPIAHSKSPQIHGWFAEQTGQQMDYRAILAPEDDFEGSARQFFDAGGLGANVTVPFKLDALVFSDQLSPRARRAGAVNTLQKGKNGEIYGDNTDGIGLVRDLSDNLGFNLRGKRVLLLGAGGASRGVIEPLLKAGIARLKIANRTPEKAQQLVQIFHGLQPDAELSAGNWASLNASQYDLILNATSASLSGDLPPLPDGLLAAGALAYDLMYARQATPFMRWAEAQGAAQVADGLGMLVEQAAEAFFLWRQVRPQTSGVLQRLREQLMAG